MGSSFPSCLFSFAFLTSKTSGILSFDFDFIKVVFDFVLLQDFCFLLFSHFFIFACLTSKTSGILFVIFVYVCFFLIFVGSLLFFLLFW